MPIETSLHPQQPTESRFQELDYKVMAHAFSVHNTYGKLHDESVYQAALLQRCVDLTPTKELPIKLTHGTFSKIYYLDICINGEAVYELKTVSCITRSHEAQLLNYLFLVDLPYGKIINFRNQSVESRFVSTSLTSLLRKKFEIDLEKWTRLTQRCEDIPQIVESILKDWGTHLDIHLYKEVIQHLVKLNAKTPINIYDNDLVIGKRDESLLSPEAVLHISSIKGDLKPYQNHLQRLFAKTQINHIQWINFAGSKIKFQSLASHHR